MKKLLRLGLVIGLLVCLIFSTNFVFAADQGAPQSLEGNRILVKFKDGINASISQLVLQKYEGVLANIIDQLGVWVVNVPSARVLDLLNAFKIDPLVEFAEIDHIASALFVPNDTYIDNQWGLTMIQADQAWDKTTGATDIKIAILDSGVDQNHADLASKIVDNGNFTTSSTIDDLNGHGTHCAGIASAITNNSIGIAGVGYSCSIMNVKVLGDNGTGYYSWIAEGITWAVLNGANVISLSLGGTLPSTTLQDAVNYAWNNGVVVVAAAGNNGNTNPFYPAYYTNCIAVAATDQNDARATFSDYGNWVDVCAPGVSIFSTLPNHTNRIGVLNYGYLDGTSMAAPFVAGLAGLVWSMDNTASNTTIRYFIENTADEIAGTGSEWVNGRINALAAVTQATPPVINTTSPLPDGAVGIPYSQTLTVSGGTAPFNWSIVSGALPDGLTLNNSNGVISGTPATDGDPVSITFRVTDNDDRTDTRVISIKINQPGLLRVQTSPAVPSRIYLDGIPRNNWALNWVKLPAGEYRLSFSDVYGFTTPTSVSVRYYPGGDAVIQPLSQPVIILPGTVTEVIANFSLMGNLRVETSPPVPATIYCNGYPMDDWGFWANLEPGEYTISFQQTEGYLTPPPIIVTVTAGTTTHVVGNYNTGQTTLLAG